MKFAVINPQGFPTAFYAPEIHGENIPAEAIEITDAQWQEFIDNQGRRRFVNGAVVPYAPPVVPVAKTWESVRLFLEEFTLQERIAIRQLAVTDPLIDDFYIRLTSANSVVADDPDLTAGLTYVVSKANGALTQARVDQILAPTGGP